MHLLNVLHRSEQHTASTAGGIVNGFSLFGIEHVDHQPYYAARGVELTSLFVGGIGEFLDEIFIGIAQHVGGDVFVAQW